MLAAYLTMMLLSGLVVTMFAGAVATSSSPEIFRRIERSSGAPRVLYVAAHPDDENTRLLAWLVHHEGAEAAYLSLTRGEGGQNLIGSEQGPALGLIRTQELLAARRIDGAEQFFGRQADFGYSKSHEETLRLWGKDVALGDVVWAIRKFRPDVIVTRFSPEGRDTHGHHTASAILAREAFTAAADAKQFTEQLQFVGPWQATRVVWNAGFFGRSPKPEEVTGLVTVDVGGYDALLGESYPELAARSRSMHKSQGFGAIPTRGQVFEYFKLLAGRAMSNGLFDGVERKPLLWAKDQFSFDNPAASVAGLLKLAPSPALDAAIADAAGVFLDASVAEALQVPGGSTKLTVTTINRSSLSLSLRRAELVFVDGTQQVVVADKPLLTNQALTVEHTLQWPSRLHDTTRPQLLVGLPMVPAPARVRWVVDFGGRSIELWRTVQRTWNDPVVGERHAPIVLAPAVTVTPREPVMVFGDAKSKTLQVRVRASRHRAQGVLRVVASAGVVVKPATQVFALAQAEAEQVLVFEVQPSKGGVVRFELDDGPARSLTTIDYAHIPSLQVLTPAEVRIARVELVRAGSRIGYIVGAGDEVPGCLRQVGYEVTLLSLDEVERDSLDQFDAIVVGIRAFNTHARLAALLPRLMTYVQGGGTVVEQYNTNSFIGALSIDIGPYPFSISHDRVTEEDASMTMLQPSHPVWTTPNVITAADFEGWVQERGLYFANKWDEHYTPLLASHDTGGPETQGGLLVARHGKGRFVYTGLSFFRQLPAGVPGAYRLFANLLAK